MPKKRRQRQQVKPLTDFEWWHLNAKVLTEESGCYLREVESWPKSADSVPRQCLIVCWQSFPEVIDWMLSPLIRRVSEAGYMVLVLAGDSD